MIKGGYIVSALCVYALLSVAISCTPASAAETAPRQEIMVSVPLSRLTELQSLINRQEQRLNQLLLPVERAEQRAESAAAANQSAQARAADCKKLVDKLQSDNQRAKQIIDELIRGAQTGAAQDAAH